MAYKYQTGDYFSGVLLETCKDAGISRPRVRPISVFPTDIRVEFPRKLREEHPVGTRFRALVKVAQKTDKKTGQLRGNPYLVATVSSITPEDEYSPTRQIFAIPIGDRKHEYVEQSPALEESPLETLRKAAYDASVDEVAVTRTTTTVRKRDPIIRAYAIERAKGVCEGCKNPAPFETKNGDPYLEVHHITALSEGGSDHPVNVAAICPNCHRRTEKSVDKEDFNESLRIEIAGIEAAL